MQLGMMDGYGGYGMWFLWLVFWILVLIGLAILIRYLWMGRREESALETLKKRYAKGEINKEEYEEKKKDLL